MSWGDRFAKLYNDASDAAQETARTTMASAQAAAKAVAHGAVKAGEAAVDSVTAAGKAVIGAAVATASAVADAAVVVGHIAGEVVNFAGSAAVITSAYLFSAAAYPFRLATKVFSSTNSPEKTVVIQCPGAKTDIFNNEYRKKLVDSQFAGANNPALRQAMVELSKDDPSNVEKNLQIIARERNRPVEQVKDEYDIYRAKRAMVIDRIDHSDNKLEPIDELLPAQSDFMGSNWQLRYGKIVGDNLGIDPVFGAMLNPTGGMVGPGNKGKAPDAWYMPTPVAYHGAYHDAAGYLYNYHKTGPGYNYVESPLGLSTENPLAGQGTGIAQWTLNTSP